MAAALKRLSLAILLVIGGAYAWAQLAPVPALPDSDRLTEYTGVSASTGPFDVGFALYGDGSDYQNWIKVYVNGVETTAYTLTSPSGVVGSITLPITDAQITFSAAQTGTVDIVGADRPRRLSQLSENRGVSAHDFNVIITKLVAELREAWDERARTVRVPPGETAPVLPSAASRAGKYMTFDASGNPTASTSITGGTTVSAAMQPVVESATTSAAAALLGLQAVPVGTVMQFGGFTAPTNYDFPYGQAYSRANYPDLETALTISQSGTCTSSSTTISGLSDTSKMAVGERIEGSDIPSLTNTIASIISSTSITVSAAATSGGACTIKVFPYGNGDGLTTFNLPDLRGRVVAGPDAMGGTAASRLTSTYYGSSAGAPAVIGGSQSEVVAQANLPSVNFVISGITASSSNPSIGLNTTLGGSGSAFNYPASGGTPTPNVVSTPTITITSQGTAASGGSGTPVATIQPTITMNYIMRVSP